MMLARFRYVLPLLLTCLAVTSQAQHEPTPEQQAKIQELTKLADGLKYQEGKITLPGNVATIQVGEGFRFLDAKDSQTVLTKIWNNPPSQKTLGMLFPKGATPLEGDAWAVVLSFEKSGFVKDSEAAKLDYGKLLADMQASTKAANAEREKLGFPSIDLVNWATTPHYDSASHKIYWAKELRFGDSSEETLNYCIRALGRYGVLELNAVAPMDQLKQIEAATPTILSMVEFEPGQRYADFNASTDKVAEYGIAALIAGGVLAKTGILKGLLVAILAAKKFVIVGLEALWGGVKKLFAKASPPSQRNLDV